MRSILPLVLLPVSPVLLAGTVAQQPLLIDRGNATALLEATAQRHVDAMHRIISRRWADAYSARRWEVLENSMARTPVARLTYQFTSQGAPGVRVYHALGGPPLGALAQETFAGPTPPGSPDSLPDGFEYEVALSEEEREAMLRAYALQDAEDTAMHVANDDVNVRAGVPPREASAFHPYEIDGMDRALDAEFKALAALERDLRAGVLPQGGTVNLLVSSDVCHSCDYAIRTAARVYDVDVEVHRMASGISAAARDQWIADGTAVLKGSRLVHPLSGKPVLASDALASARDAQVRQSLTPVAVRRTVGNVQWEGRLFRLEARTGAVAAEAVEPGTVPSPPGC